MEAHEDDSINIFFSLLRSGLYGKPIPEPELPDAIDWEAVIAFADKQAVFGIIIESVQMLPERLRPSAEIQTQMSKFALGLIQATMILDRTVARVVSFFKEHGIDGVLLKGQGVARYYRAPQMRHVGDVDLYIGKASYKKAVKLCREKLMVNQSACEETDLHFAFKTGGVEVELHRLATRIYSPFRKKMFQDWIEEQLERSANRRTLTIGGAEVTVPSIEFDAIFIFYHAWRHYIMEGVGLRQLCDWAMIFHSHGDDIDAARLTENLRRFGLTKCWKLFACIAVKYLGVPEDKMPLYDPSYDKRSEKIFDEIVAGGNFGAYAEANIRTRTDGTGLRHGLGLVGNITKDFVSLFPLLPVEATFLYFNRMFYGVMSFAKRSMHK